MKSVNETYFQHFGQAIGFSLTLAMAAVVCLVHALLPFLFERTGSQLIGRLHERMLVNRKRKAVADDRVEGSVGAPSA
ncbi:MAG: DUF6356 family protein [Gammaproteobacteria bacterium]|nr:DUF6356 family protein [Gammaproteobacteria bacterium]